MNDISVFDVIGPNMIGPSSSHTAGALRIAHMAKKMVPGSIAEVEFVLYGSFAQTYRGHGTDRALLGGIMGFSAEDRRIRDSYRLADEAGIRYAFRTDVSKQDVHPNTVEIHMTDAQGHKASVTGVSIGGGNALLKKINEIDVDITGNYETMIILQDDKPGVAAHVTKCFYEENVNIAFLNIYRHNKGDIAYCVIEVDSKITETLVEKVKAMPLIKSVNLIQL